MKRMNLLPKQRQAELRYERLFHGVTVAAVMATAILLLGVVAQLAVWTYFNQSQGSTIRAIDELKQAIDKTEYSQLKQEIRKVNAQMVDFENLALATPQLSKVLEAFARDVPRDVKIDRLNIDLSTNKVDISGYSPTREAVIDLYNNINNNKVHFKDIDYPLENVAKPTDVQFKFTFYINPEVINGAAK